MSTKTDLEKETEMSLPVIARPVFEFNRTMWQISLSSDFHKLSESEKNVIRQNAEEFRRMFNAVALGQAELKDVELN